MKILHIVRQFHPMIGGIENYVLSLALEQQKQHDVTVLTLNRSFIDGHLLPPTDKIESVQVIRIPYFGSNKYPLAFSAYKYLKNFDVIHVHCVDFFIDYLAITKLFHGKRLILTTHGGFFHTKSLGIIKKLFFNFITRFTVKLCDQVIACGDNDYAIFSKISNKIVKIDNGINTKPYLATNKDVKKGRLVYVGRIDVHKRIDNLIRVTAEIHKQGVPVSLSIIGPDWNKQKVELEQLAHTLGISNIVKFEGSISSEALITAYQQANIFVSASEYEGFGISAIEALASGTLSVVHQNDSFLKLFHNKPFAKLSNFSNSAETANKIIEFIQIAETEYANLSIKAREYAQNYSWQYVEKNITNLYTQIV